MKRIIKYILLYICLFFSPYMLCAQEKEISGYVVEESGRPVAGVEIRDDRGSLLAQTDAAGSFACTSVSGNKLRLVKTGYVPAEVIIGGKNQLYILKPDYLEESVDVGYAAQKRRNITGSVSSVSGKLITDNSAVNPSLAFYGLIPGLIIEEKTGELGSYSPNFFIRGKSTFGAAVNVPIVLVDGFERDMKDLSLDDIESITVLKDAASTAIYGMRGANGVILIDTKRGRDGRVKFNVSFEQGFQTPYRIPEFVNSGEYAQLYNQALINDGLAPKYSAEEIAGYQAGNSIYHPDVQWQKELVKNMAPTTDVNVSADGGNKYARYYVSLGYTRNTGLFSHTDEESDKYSTQPRYNRYGFRTNLDIVAIKNLDIRLDISGKVEERNMPRYGSADIWNMIYKYPQHEFPMFLPDGGLGGTAAYSNNVMGYVNNSGYRHILDRYVQTGVSAEYHLGDLSPVLKGLSIGARYAYDNAWTVTETYSKTFSVKEILGQQEDGSPIYSALINKDSQLGYGIGNDVQSRQENFEGFVKYHRTFGGRHDVNVMAMYHQDKLMTDQVEPVAIQFIGGRLNYAYDSKYLAEFTFSYSGSEAFAENNRFAFFPAASFGWVLSEENFLKGSKHVDFLKLRGSVGVVGNCQLGADNRFAYREITTLISNNYYWGINPDAKGGRKVSKLANPGMKPEKGLKVDVGVEAQLFKSLYVQANYFFENRYDILTSQTSQIPSVIGVTLPNINAGRTHTHGIELALNYNRQINRNWSVFGNFNLLWYKNTIEEMQETPLPENSTYQYQVGYPVGSQLGLIALGFFQSQEEIDQSPIQQFSQVQPGDIKYLDVNNDGFINDYDRVWNNASAVPNLDMGLNLGVRFKSFDLSAILHAQFGTEIYLGNAGSLFWPLNNNAERITRWVADRHPWTPETASYARYPRLTTTGSANNYRRSSFWTMDGDQLKLRKLEIGYTLPVHVSKKFAVSKLRIYLRGVNLFSLDRLKFVDPAAMGGDPMLRSYYVGCNITF